MILKQKADLNEVNSELKLSDEEKYHTIYYGEILAKYYLKDIDINLTN